MASYFVGPDNLLPSIDKAIQDPSSIFSLVEFPKYSTKGGLEYSNEVVKEYENDPRFSIFLEKYILYTIKLKYESSFSSNDRKALFLLQALFSSNKIPEYKNSLDLFIQTSVISHDDINSTLVHFLTGLISYVGNNEELLHDIIYLYKILIMKDSFSESSKIFTLLNSLTSIPSDIFKTSLVKETIQTIIYSYKEEDFNKDLYIYILSNWVSDDEAKNILFSNIPESYQESFLNFITTEHDTSFFIIYFMYYNKFDKDKAIELIKEFLGSNSSVDFISAIYLNKNKTYINKIIKFLYDNDLIKNIKSIVNSDNVKKVYKNGIVSLTSLDLYEIRFFRDIGAKFTVNDLKDYFDYPIDKERLQKISKEVTDKDFGIELGSKGNSLLNTIIRRVSIKNRSRYLQTNKIIISNIIYLNSVLSQLTLDQIEIIANITEITEDKLKKLQKLSNIKNFVLFDKIFDLDID